MRAAAGEAATRSRICRIRRLAGEKRVPLAPTSIRGAAASRGARIRMVWIAKQLRCHGPLDHPARIHDRHVMGEMPHDGQIMGNENEGDTGFALQILQQIDDLRLNRNVECRHRLVADNQIRLY